ncbi:MULTISPECIES: type II secretion system F family protein [Rhodanobacter]|jgi:tight adherence protein B|uniref:Type II secretion system F domain-containing protein n=2 Tax=Rhodanobacter TaxID=75309 RepID=I4W205_9GAMM|nr:MULTISPECIES: type II secretion system F family protein [Rhodanobacter]EIL93496.1 type II secretion system F domain-containing protein [Rhodanobacter spathiphylli B39]KQZ79704.1 type II secretion protein F [Rhodanobacter sp. Root561]KRB52703.1 type II secretion protein F [Rhodanobacter sp. Root179]QRP64372.1 type II secretion system F family protein [Rhodanobacter sp. FDAARGOS 1247]
MSLLPVAIVVFLAVAAIGYLAARSSTVFWGRYQEAFTEQARFNLADMFMFMDERNLFRLNAVAMVLVPLLVWFLSGNPLLAIVTLVLILVLPKKIYRWLRQRRINQIQQQLPDGLMMVAGSMRAGLGFTPALESLARDVEPPLAQEFALLLREQRMGVKLEEALEHFNDRVPIQDVTLFVSAVGISREVGGNLAESMASLADTLRRRLIMEGKVNSLTAQGRLQGIVMAMMPVGLIGFLSFAYPDTMHEMYHSYVGWAVIAVAAVMEYLGYRMCRKITSIDI